LTRSSEARFKSGAVVRLDQVPDTLSVTPVDMVAEDGAFSRGLLYAPRATRPRVGVHLMHPRTDQTQHYSILPLARAGCAVLGHAGRAVNNDTATVHEPLLLDVAAGVRHLREEVGCEIVLLLGSSGGAPLAAFYQWQAAATPPSRLAQTPAGDQFDLNGFALPPADGVILLGGHLGEGELLLKWIDPSVYDERDPLSVDPALDMYDAMNGFQTPPKPSAYSADFIAEYRGAQRARVARLDAFARQVIGAQRVSRKLLADPDPRLDPVTLARQSGAGWHMVLYRTTADPAFLDPSIDPDDRLPASYFSFRPDLENYGTNGFARVLTPQAWLSTWSGLSSRVRTVDGLASFDDPLLIVHYAGDAGCRLSEAEAMLESSASPDKSLQIVRNADHYAFVINPDGSQGARTAEGTDHIVTWVKERYF
jgi:hypothetical protein